MSDLWHPTPGDVLITAAQKPAPGTIFAIHCSACGQRADTPGNHVAAVAAADAHRCPVGTERAQPQCPTCGATGPRCPGSSIWHETRIHTYDEAVFHHV